MNSELTICSDVQFTHLHQDRIKTVYLSCFNQTYWVSEKGNKEEETFWKIPTSDEVWKT